MCPDIVCCVTGQSLYNLYNTVLHGIGKIEQMTFRVFSILLWWDVVFRGLSGCPVCPMLTIFSFLSSTGEVLEYQIYILTWDPWDILGRHLVAPQTTSRRWLTRTTLFWEAHNGDLHIEAYSAETRCIPLRLRCTEHPGTFPSAHIHIHIHMAKTIPAVCHPKTTAACNWGDKERGGKLSPAGEHSLWSGEKDESKGKACLTEAGCLASLLDDPQRDTGIDQRRRGPPQEQPGGRRNLLLHSQMYFWRDKCSPDESRPFYWCDHCLSSVMPHDIRRCLDHSLTCAPAASASVVFGCWCVFAGFTLNYYSTDNSSSRSFWVALNTTTCQQASLWWGLQLMALTCWQEKTKLMICVRLLVVLHKISKFHDCLHPLSVIRCPRGLWLDCNAIFIVWFLGCAGICLFVVPFLGMLLSLCFSLVGLRQEIGTCNLRGIGVVKIL